MSKRAQKNDASDAEQLFQTWNTFFAINTLTIVFKNKWQVLLLCHFN